MTIDADPIVFICLTVAALGILALAALEGMRRRRRDPQRLFSHTQKRALLQQAGHRCEHKHPLWRRCRETTRLQADHIMPWSRGGPTQLWNGQILCREHNRRKSNLVPRPLYRWRLTRRRRKY